MRAEYSTRACDAAAGPLLATPTHPSWAICGCRAPRAEAEAISLPCYQRERESTSTRSRAAPPRLNARP
ncbi:hypothetical protein DFH09DRAFT_1331326 [Mycena vulgaris]|nr:hypothetical protein DFH09DRAFT_1331326 [Mycena vulgaris]